MSKYTATGGKGFDYSDDFKSLLLKFLQCDENLPNYEAYLKANLGGPESRFVLFMEQLCPEIEYHCGSLKDMRVLDMGCGPGATTAALAYSCDHVCTFDIDEGSVEVCRQRIKEHGLESRVEFFSAPDLESIRADLGTFDLILLNAVIEHIPISVQGLRRHVLQTSYGMLRNKGWLYINDTPNRVWPVDKHSTQLWWLPWTKPGSRWAFNRAVRKGRYREGKSSSPGTRGLEEFGVWGATYWEIMSYLDDSAVCLNLKSGHDRHLNHTFATRRGKILDPIMYPFAKLIRAPLTAFAPGIVNLVIQKT